MLQSIVRFALGVLFTWLVAKGAVTQDQVNSNLPTIVEFVCMLLLTVGSIGWTYFEKLAAGHITALGTKVTIDPITINGEALENAVTPPVAPSAPSPLKPSVDSAGNVTLPPKA